MSYRPFLSAVAAAVLASAALVACSGPDEEGTAGDDGTSTTVEREGSTTTAALPDGVNRIDVAFAQGMIPHHAQAVEMSELAATNGASPEVQALASQIIAAQQPEIDQMTAWLEAWGQPVPDSSLSMEEQMEAAGGMMMSGMVSSSDMDRLREAQGAEFDRLFLEFMILHHEGAIQMADQELDGGQDPQVTQLAQQIKDAQAPEIERMNELLQQSG
jgi:uncharacterized protein (DUF305 family)